MGKKKGGQKQGGAPSQEKQKEPSGEGAAKPSGAWQGSKPQLMSGPSSSQASQELGQRERQETQPQHGQPQLQKDRSLTQSQQQRQPPQQMQPQQQQQPPQQKQPQQQRQPPQQKQPQQQQQPPQQKQPQQQQPPQQKQPQQQQQPPQQKKPQQQQPQKQPEQPSQTKQTQQKQSQQGQKAQQAASPPVKQPSDQSVARLSTSMSKMSLMTIPVRKNPGHSGRKTRVEVNHLQLDFSRICKEIIHYDIAVDPDKPKRLIRTAVDAFARKHFPKYNTAFDGNKNLYAARKLPFGRHLEDTVKVMNPERQTNNEIEFRVAIQEAQVLQTNSLMEYMTGKRREIPQSVIQAVDVVLRTAPLRGSCVPVGRSYFTGPSEEIIDLGGGLHLWYGFYQSAILGWKPFLNVDVAHKGFPKPVILTELLMDVCNLSSLNDNLSPMDIKKFKGMVCTMKVDYEIPNQPGTRRTYRVNNLGESCRRYKFKGDNKQEVSILQYFLQEKNYRIQYPDLPTIQVDPPKKGIFLPMELCRMKPGQAINRKLDDRQTATMVRAAAKPPDVRKRRILDAIRMANYRSSPAVKDFNIDVSSNFEQVGARVLDAPGIEYKDIARPRPSPGQWRAGQFIGAAQITKWYILNLDYRTGISKLQDFSMMLKRQGSTLGMRIENVSDIKNVETRNQFNMKKEIIKLFQSWKSAGAELVVVVIPALNDIYGQVKQIAELEIGVLTQCVRSQTMYKMNPATCGNILLKVNSKKNGVNHILGKDFVPPIFAKPVMFVGIDVTHPSPDQTSIPSVAAVSASHDARGFQYNMIWRLQPPRVEIIEDLANIMIEQLRFFYRRTTFKPEKIVVYRDGVSEGQFQQVMAAELTAIRQACATLNPNYKPGITFLVVQKRHHIRLFPINREDMDGKNRNVPPGTIVDTVITHPKELDFYLVSHSSLQGTSRPTKYHRLWDDNNISEDELEILTYYLCYLFSRCTRSVSYPAPTYYAHLAAFRARVYLENKDLSVSPEGLQSFQGKNSIVPEFAMNSPMFFV